MSKVSFGVVSNSGECFRCPRCLLAHQTVELAALKRNVEALTLEVSGLKSLILFPAAAHQAVNARQVTSEVSPVKWLAVSMWQLLP